MRPLLSGEGAKDQASARPNRYFALSRRSLSLAKPGHPNREELCAIRNEITGTRPVMTWSLDLKTIPDLRCAPSGMTNTEAAYTRIGIRT
jgi:hypothetical protein